MKTNPAKLKQPGYLIPRLSLIIATVILVACGEKPQPQTTQPPAAKLFQDQRDALDKAKSASQTEAKSADDLKHEEEKQTK
jgi:uncharacterized lipoprotein YajG